MPILPRSMPTALCPLADVSGANPAPGTKARERRDDETLDRRRRERWEEQRDHVPVLVRHHDALEQGVRGLGDRLPREAAGAAETNRVLEELLKRRRRPRMADHVHLAVALVPVGVPGARGNHHRLARPGRDPVAAREEAARARQHLEALLHRRMDVGSDPTARIDPGLYVEDLGAVLVGRAAYAQALAEDWIFDRLHNLVLTTLQNLRRPWPDAAEPLRRDAQHVAGRRVVHRRELHVRPEVDVSEALQQFGSAALLNASAAVNHEVFAQADRVEAVGHDREAHAR